MYRIITHILPIAWLLLLTQTPAIAGLRLPALVGDNMVLQQGRALPIWGWAAPQEKVTVSFLSKDYTTQAGADGKWMVQLAPAKAGGPHSMTIRGATDKIEIKNILIGEVWLCSGQSNMALDFNYGPVKARYAAVIAGSRNDQIRQLLINRTYGSFPADDAKSSGWKSAAPETLPPFSAAAYFFARSLYEQYKVPIGLINSSYGGTLAEAWTSAEGLRSLPQFQPGLQLLKDTTALRNRIELSKQQMASWDSLIAATDKGLSPAGEPLWKGAADTAHWKRMPVTGYWDRNGLPNTWGVVWLKKEIVLNEQQAQAEATLVLGRLDDADITWVNGKKAGTAANRDARRQYKLPTGLLHAGSNEVLIRLVNYNGTGGFNPDDSVWLDTGKEKISLKADWLMKPGTVTSMQKEGQYDPKNLPSSLYNAMIAPLLPVAIKGVIWYQGEFNAVRAFEYRQLFPALINDWRAHWGDSTLPFIFQQLPNFQKPVLQPSQHPWAELREAQLMALRLPHTGMSVGIDIGEDGDLHPSNKQPVGERLALLARRIAYGERIVASGPLYRSMEIRGDTIVLQFETSGSMLVAGDGKPLRYFSIAGADRQFKWATAFIKDNKVFVFNSALHNPVAVRYGWASNPEGCNLYNPEGLPASPFRTDDWSLH